MIDQPIFNKFEKTEHQTKVEASAHGMDRQFVLILKQFDELTKCGSIDVTA